MIGRDRTERSPMDRRKRRTRRLLREALLELILEKDYDAITVQNILERADVGRSTFYAHFANKDDMLSLGLPNDLLRYGEDGSDDGAPVAEAGTLPSVAGLFAHVLEGQSWMRAMHGNRGMAQATQLARERMRENWLGHLRRLEAEGWAPPEPLEAVAAALTGSLMLMLQWWIEDGMRVAPTEMDALFRQLVEPGLGPRKATTPQG
jgi:AcrR family transcriptional regulator